MAFLLLQETDIMWHELWWQEQRVHRILTVFLIGRRKFLIWKESLYLCHSAFVQRFSSFLNPYFLPNQVQSFILSTSKLLYTFCQHRDFMIIINLSGVFMISQLKCENSSSGVLSPSAKLGKKVCWWEDSC